MLNLINNKIVHNRIYSRSLLLQEYDFEIRYIPGKTNILTALLTSDDEKGFNEYRKCNVAVNVLGDKKGIFSDSEVFKDQMSMTDKNVIKCKKNYNIFVKITNY